MQQLNGDSPTTATPSQVSATGPGPDTTTNVVNGVDFRGADDTCFAEVQVRINRGRVVFSGVLQMGGRVEATRYWERRSGRGAGWVSTQEDFIDFAEGFLGPELAEYLDGLPFPFAVANLLPRPATAAGAAARAEAAKEVGNA